MPLLLVLMNNACALHNEVETEQDVRRRRRLRTALYNEAKLQSFLNGEIRFRRNIVMQPSGKETQRMTGYLRAYGGVSSDVSREPVFLDERLIQRKKKIHRANSPPEKKWSDVKVEIAERCGRSQLPMVRLLERVKWNHTLLQFFALRFRKR